MAVPFGRAIVESVRQSMAAAIACALVVALVPAPASATGPTIAAIDPVPARALLRPVKTFKVAPIPDSRFIRTNGGARTFVRLPTVDAHGNPVPDQTPIKTPTGATMAAGDYWAQVNAIERKLNAKGESIRDGKIDDGRLSGSTQSELAASITYKPHGAAKLHLGAHYLAVLTTLGHKRFVVASSASAAPPRTRFTIASPTPAPSATPHHGIPSQIGPSPRPSFGPISVPNSNGGAHSPVPTPVGQVANPQGYGTTSTGSTGSTASGGSPSSSGPSQPVCQWAPGNQSQGIAAANILGLAIKKAGCAPITGLPPAAPSGSPATFNLPWQASFGDPSTAQFFLNANLSLTADPSKSAAISTATSANVGAYLLNGGGNIFGITTQVQGTTATVNVLLFNTSVYSQSVLSYNFDDPQTFFNIQVAIPILFFDLILSASATGDFGINFSFALSNGSATASVTPFVNLAGAFSASIGIDIVIASVSVGVYGDLNIANVKLPFAANAGFTLQQTTQGPPAAAGFTQYSNTGVPITNTGTTSNQIIGCQLEFQHALTLDFDYQLLSGSFGVQAQACFLLYCDTAQHQLYSWNGITGNDNELDDRGTAQLIGPSYTDLPEYGFALAGNQQYSPDDQNEEPAVCDQFSTLVQ